MKKHGQSFINGKRTPEYNAWRDMKIRCSNPNNKYYHCYGERGIKVCNRWRYSFPNFFNDMGKKPSPIHQLDRINNNRNYTPSNCRWTTPTKNSNNKRNNVFIEYMGERKTIAEWSRHLNIPFSRISYRHLKNFPVEKILSTKKLPKTKGKFTYNGKTLTLKKWAENFNISYNTLIGRIYTAKWPFEKSLLTPPSK